MAWDPDAYETFAAQRARPFQDLLARVALDVPTRIVDAGCGTGWTTSALAERWPQADVLGVDASPDMLAAARNPNERVRFEVADLATWMPEESVDLIVANAVLHWIPEPVDVLGHLVSWLSPEGVLAVQVPANHEAPSHTIVTKTAARTPWHARLHDLPRGDHVLNLEGYHDALQSLGCSADAWETTYLHRLEGPDAVLRWLQGTTLRPHIARLGDDAASFMEELRAPLAEAYPTTAAGTHFRFARRFLVAQK